MSIYSINGNALSHAYNKDGSELVKAYDIDGEQIFPTGAINYNSFTETLLYNIKIGTQGTTVYGDYLFQVISGTYKLNVYDVTNGSLVSANIGGTYGHGDSLDFSNEYYDESDPFPLLYASADDTSDIYVMRISTKWSASLLRTLSFDYATAGYHACGVVDKENNILYTSGYTNNSYLVDDGTNLVKCCKWDLDDLTLNQNGTYTPALLDSWTVPFIYTMQGGDFHDNKIWWGSGYKSGQETMHIYAIDVIEKRIAYVLTLTDSYEPEGLAWLNDQSLFLSQRINSSADSTYGTNYLRLDFAQD